MRPREDSARRGAATRAIALLLIAGALLPACVATSIETTGNDPVNARVPESARERELRMRRKDAADAAAIEKDTASRPPVPTSVAASVRHRQYHRDGCPRLTETPAADRTTFTSPYTAIDAGFEPCAHCRPGP